MPLPVPIAPAVAAGQPNPSDLGRVEGVATIAAPRARTYPR